jgi:hypothetical protein
MVEALEFTEVYKLLKIRQLSFAVSHCVSQCRV